MGVDGDKHSSKEYNLQDLKKILECEEVVHRRSYDVSHISGNIH